MINAITNKPIVVTRGMNSRGEHSPGSFPLPVSQVEDVRRVLDAHGFRYWVTANYWSKDDGPMRTTVILYHATDAQAVQRALDAVP